MKHASYFLETIPTKCVGCGGCIQICPTNAISFHEDEEGFFYPVLDETKCVNCGLCEKVCPFDNGEKTKNLKGKSYAFQLSDRPLLIESSSGGGFVAVAKRIIEKGGVVYGSALEGTRVRHKRIDNIKNLPFLMGSKYVQSDIGDTYIQVRSDLKKGLNVLFVGCPCQVSGLKLFLQKHYDNLITLDLVCHGVPSPKLFDYTIKRVEKRLKAKFKSYSFRDKKVGGWSICSTSKYEKNGKSIYLKYAREMDAYFQAFISGHLMRKSCYECRFSCLQRVGDITLADYWGVNIFHPEISNINDGVSLLTVNSDKGEKMIKILSQNNFCCEVDLLEASSMNRNMIMPTTYPLERGNAYRLAFSDYKGFLKKYSCSSFEELKRLFIANIMYQLRKNKKKYEMFRKLKRVLK